MDRTREPRSNRTKHSHRNQKYRKHSRSGGGGRVAETEDNAEIRRRIRQLEDGGDPLSLAEQIAHDYDFQAGDTLPEQSEPQGERANIQATTFAAGSLNRSRPAGRRG